MQRSMFRAIVVIVLTIYAINVSAQDTLKVMVYNLLNFPGSTPERVEQFRIVCGYTTPDVLLVNELSSDDGAVLLLDQGLNVLGKTSYHKAEFTDGPDTDNMLFYNSDKLGLYSQDTINTDLRLINEYILYYKPVFAPIGTDTTFLHFFVTHLKSSTGSSNEQRRLAEVTAFRQHLFSKGITDNIFFGGDFNFYDSSEPAYDSLVNSVHQPLIDPLPAGDWHDAPEFASIHTQSTRTAQFGGGASGGLDDRFDFMLFSQDISTGQNGINYIPGSCSALGNDGNHLNMSILDPPVNPGVPDSVIQALYFMSDHLPVLCKVAVQTSTIPVTRSLDIRVFLQGPFVNNEMQVNLTGLLPVQQPYKLAPWNYNGDEMLTAPPGPDVVDWLLVELRQSPYGALAALSDTAIWREACLLMRDGSILQADQLSYPEFEYLPEGNIYIVIRHRNHLDIMASGAAQLTGNSFTYDFTTAGTSVINGPVDYVELVPGIWGMAAGDLNADGKIDINDLTEKWNVQAGISGYLEADPGLDGQADNSDKNLLVLPNLSKISPLNY